ncbi:MAG: glycoside hydrolase family 16 protein [Aquisalimonadaceae bacterium]
MSGTDSQDLIFEDDFDDDQLDTGKWFPHYLPHWSSLTRSAASYRIEDSRLRLFIREDQRPWCPEFDGEVKVSGIQTGHFSGALGSRRGQHRFSQSVQVREELPNLRLFLPQYCRLEMKARASLNPWNLAALWLIGFEDDPDQSGEITLFEAFGHDVQANSARIGRGIKKIHDPHLRDAIDQGELAISVSEWHVYSMDWTPFGVAFYVDGKLVTQTTQSPSYPMQLMLNFYDLPSDAPRTSSKEAWFDVDFIRAYRRYS